MSFRFWKVEKYFHFKTKQLIFWHHSESKEDRRNKINNFKLILRYDLRYIFGVEMQKNCMRNLRTFAIFHLSLCRNCIFNSRFMGKGSLIERAWNYKILQTAIKSFASIRIYVQYYKNELESREGAIEYEGLLNIFLILLITLYGKT